MLKSLWLPLLLGCVVLAAHAEEDLAGELRKSADHLMVYYRSPKPERFAELLRLMDGSTNRGTDAVFSGFAMELFRAHPERLPAWLEVLNRCKDPATRLSLRLIAAAVCPQYRMLIADLPHDIPTPEQIEEYGSRDPDFTWGRFFATGDAKHVDTILRLALTQHKRRDEINIYAFAARWSLFALSRQQPEVENIFRELLRKCADDEVEFIFANADAQTRLRLLGAERAAKLPPPEEPMPENPFAGLFEDWKDRPTPRESFRRRFDAYVAELVKVYPSSPPAAIRKFMVYYYIGADKHYTDGMSRLRRDDPWAEAVRATQLLEAGRGDEGKRALRELSDRLPAGDLLRLELLKMLRGTEKHGSDEYKLCERQLADNIESAVCSGEHIGSEIYMWLYNELSNCTTLGKRYWGELELKLKGRSGLDPWFLAMVGGRAAIFWAWESRGSGWGNSVTPEGWKGFDAHLNDARRHFETAIKLFPERYNAHIRLITVEMGAWRHMRMIDAFKKIVRYDASNESAWRNILWGLLPRWGGSFGLMKMLAVEALDCPRRDVGVAECGYQALAAMARRWDDYRWQRIYLDEEVRNRAERLFAEHERRAETPEERREFQWHKFCRLLALLEYDTAAEALRAYGGAERVAREKRWHWGFAPDPGIGTPRYDDPLLRLRVFTSKHAAELRKAERDFLFGEDPQTACGELAEIIRRGDFPNDEKSFLIDMYGRWRLNREPDTYCRSDGKYLAAYALAARVDRKVAAEMDELGQTAIPEKFPGERVYTIAMYGKDTDGLRRLHAAGARLDLRDPRSGFAPIHVAAAQGRTKMLVTLLELGVPIETRCRDGHAPLHLAATFKHFETVGALLERGADPNAQDNEGDFCLIYLPQVHAPGIFYKKFLEHPQIEVNLRNHAGESAMHHMAKFGTDLAVWKMFTAAGADVNIRDGRGRTPLDAAEEKGNREIAEFLRGVGGKRGSELPPRKSAATPRPQSAAESPHPLTPETIYLGGTAALMLLVTLAALAIRRFKRTGD